MARLTKDQLGDRGRFQFKQEEVEVPGLDGSVMVRSPSVGQRDELAKKTPDDNNEWTVEHTALLFSTIVVDPQLTQEEAAAFLNDWPGEALDAIVRKFSELTGTREVLRQAAGEFHSGDGVEAEVRGSS